MYLLCGFSKTFMVIIKKNFACLNDLANSRQPANIGKKTTSSMEKRKGHKTSSKGVPISFFQKPKEPTKPSNKEINSVSLNHESAELPKSLTKSVFSVAT